MGAPADVVQQAGGFDEAFARVRGGAVERQDEVIEHLAKAGHPCVLGFSEIAGFDQRITVAQALRHLLVKHAFADAVAGNGDVLGAEGLDQTAQHFGGVGDQ